jgi:GT2 family glycosyltransferase
MLTQGGIGPEVVPTLSSLEAQTDFGWFLTVVIEEDQHTALVSMLGVSGLRRSTQRVRILKTNGPASVTVMFDLGLQAESGSDVALIFPGDVWAPDAVARFRRAIPPGGMAYADEDRITPEGRHQEPRLKPAFSPELLLRTSYIGRPMALSADVAARLPASETAAWEDFEHDLSLRATEISTRVEHIPEVLCHGATTSGAVKRSEGSHVASALRRRGDIGTVSPGLFDTFRITRPCPTDCLASIIIPFRDAPRLLRTCVDSIDATRGTSRIELLLVDNGSVEPETATLIEHLEARADVHVLRDPRPFNWAQLNNAAAEQASGDVLIFLNNDIEARSEGWLQALCAQAMRPGVGAVGARLLYPDLRVQHCGVVIGLGGAAGHVLVGLAGEAAGYLGMAVTTRECAAVTGACLATSRSVFAELNGFDESLGIDLNDVDYCLRAQRIGRDIVCEAEAELIHHESPSRGTAGDVRDIVHFIDRWEASILRTDPYFHPALTRIDSSCALRGAAEEEWWHQWRANLSTAT